MIPHTPLVLVTSVQSLVHMGAKMQRRRRSLPCSLDFVLSVGETSHLDLDVGLSSWPVSPVSSFAELRAMAHGRRWARQRPQVGDLFLFRDRETNGREMVGVVMSIMERVYGNPDRDGHEDDVRCCVLAWAVGDGRATLRIETGVRWVDPRGDDIAIRWYAFTDDLERAA